MSVARQSRFHGIQKQGMRFGHPFSLSALLITE